MKIKIFCPNTNGKLEFTKEELEKLLNEAYNDGYRDGNYSRTWTYTYPSITCNSSDSTTTRRLECYDGATISNLVDSTSAKSEPHNYCNISSDGQVQLDIQGLTHN